ncbi:MAG: glycosyltransferase family 2 protein [Bacteroidetes bacterium]|nr:glycosyltransferase family 2 protein [Bacteroidota bacterium]
MIDIYKGENPIVSVIMVTYNRSAYLSRSIPSFLEQTYRNTELIVVDDGSEDNTFNVVNEFMKSHTNIRYMKHSNRNISLSKNVGIRAAIGKYISFLDSDDAYQDDYLEMRVQYMEANPRIDLIEGGAIVIGDPDVKNKNNLSEKIHLSDCHIGATFFGKTEMFIAMGGFNKNIPYSEDSEFWEKAEKKFTLRKFDTPGYFYYRSTPGSICNTV